MTEKGAAFLYEVHLVEQLLKHPGAYSIYAIADLLVVRPLEDGTFEVMLDEPTGEPQVLGTYRNTADAAYFFVDQRHRRKLGPEYEEITDE